MTVARRLLQVKFRPYDIKDNPYNAAIPANVVGMVKGNQGEDDEEVLQRLAEAEVSLGIPFGKGFWLIIKRV